MAFIKQNKFHPQNTSGFYVHFCLIRSLSRTIGNFDYRNIVYTLKACNVPSINSLDSIIMDEERIVKYGELKKI